MIGNIMTNQNTAQNVSTISADIVHETVIGITERAGALVAANDKVNEANKLRKNSFLHVLAYIIAQSATMNKKQTTEVKKALIKNKVFSESKVKHYYAFVTKYQKHSLIDADGKKKKTPQSDIDLIVPCLNSLGITSYAKMDKFGKTEEKQKKLSKEAQELVKMLCEIAIDQAEDSEEFGGLVTEENKVDATTMIEEALTKWAHFLEKETK